MQIRCPKCQTKLQVSAQSAGKQVQCPCGASLKIPQKKQPANQGPIVACSCGKKLRAPASAIGKIVRCPCGREILVPKPIAAPTSATPASGAQPVASNTPAPLPDLGVDEPPSEDWLSELPPAASAPTGGAGDALDFYAASSSYSAPSAPAAAAPSAKQSSANNYLRAAEQDLAEQRRRDASREYESEGMFATESGILNGITLGGALAMIVALVWFFGVLAVGIIFFYPPVLFIIGMIGFARGLFDD